MKKLTSTLRYHGSAEVSFRKRPQGFSVVWDADSLDWKDYDADTIYRRVTDQVAPGSIVLFHNAALHTPEALPRILDTLLGDGYSVIPISQLIYTGNYTIDHTGRQFPAEQPG
ncbi:MAG: hypothetical protein IIZ26_03290 [Oscillospiraceae bacterium]|nr:hypothetical protein [Oscillospiraceae bacterium]